MPRWRVREATWQNDRAALRDIRQRVFIEEQRVPPELEWEAADLTARHLLALTEEDQPIGVARILPSGQIGRMAVLPEWRRQGVGSALLRAALVIASDGGARRPFLHAQSAAVGFYTRHGFHQVGEEFMEAGIPHVVMTHSATTE